MIETSSHARRTLILMLVLGVILALLVPAAPGEAAQNQLLPTAVAAQPNFAPGEAVTVTGLVTDVSTGARTASRVTATLRAPDGRTLGAPVETLAGPDGTYSVTFPAAATQSLTAGQREGYRLALAVDVSATGLDALAGAQATPTTQQVFLAAPPPSLTLQSSFVSSVGWVKPGEEYPFQLIVRNHRDSEAGNAVVTMPVPDGTTFLAATPIEGAGRAAIQSDGSVRWDLGPVPAGSVEEPVTRVLLVQAAADTLAEDQQIVWKDLSAEATLTSEGTTSVATSHGPKVIPPNQTYETARYGDRPFPVVPVDYSDRPHLESNSGAELSTIINDPAFAGSTFNLFQEMSYGQLYPNGTVPSAGIATAEWGDVDADDLHPAEEGADEEDCDGDYTPEDIDTDALPERIVDGFYQLPGETEYYGSDSGETGDATVDEDGNIDDACGTIGKIVYDAAALADPEIDYNQFDTDKDGVVDFFMLVYAGCGGNGPSQRGCFNRDKTIDNPEFGDAPYDNIWPHSSSLESDFFDPETGLLGFVTEDQLTTLEGVPLYYTDETRTRQTTDVTDFPVFVRVGPYNANPEDAMDFASVISHEYGHSLGLPDYYGTILGDYYGSWNLMASDYSQWMDINGRQELGWVVPTQVPAVNGDQSLSMVDHTVDIHQIEWQTPGGQQYTLSGPDVHNGDAYAVPLPHRLVIDPEIVADGASPTHVWWSGAGDNFACTPAATSHNLDIPLEVLADVPPGTPITLEYASHWDIEWDFDYGFTMVTTDGQTYQSLPNEEGYTLPADDNPFGISCQEQYGNGLTGTSGSWEDGDATEEREVGDQIPGTRFLPLTFDLSQFAGQEATIRFSYFTDAGVTRPGWFIDDVVVRAGDQVLFESNFEDDGGPDDPRIANGGCIQDIPTGPVCTEGWQYVNSDELSPADHAYYFELRDRSGFDFDARGQSDRGPIDWLPGLSLVYTDEGEGYGNITAPFIPNQHVLDDQATPLPLGEDPAPFEELLDLMAPDLSDAAWTETSTPFSDFGDGHVDNYGIPEFVNNDLDWVGVSQWVLAFDCFRLDVASMSGEDIGPSTLPGNLRADLDVRRGEGCGEYDYGYGRLGLQGPIAVAQVKDDSVVVGEEVVFDASMSSDDITPIAQLGFAWDLDGDGRTDATMSEATFAYDAPGIYQATLTVTDSDGLTATDTVEITVSVPPNQALRLAGEGRVETAIEISQAAFPDGAPAVVLARADDYPDALAAATLAAEVGGPVLLTNRDALDDQVADELERLGVESVYLAGGVTALRTAVEEAVHDLGVDTVRLAGTGRVETAALIAGEVVDLGGPVTQAIVARADNFADALSSANLATTGRAPILLTDPDALSDGTAAALEELLPDGQVYIAGGTKAVQEQVESELTFEGYTTRRLAGPTRFHTAIAVIDEARTQGLHLEPTFLASSERFPDALAAGPSAHQMGGALLLVHPDGLGFSGPVGPYLTANAEEIDTVFIAGGVAAVRAVTDPEVQSAITVAGETS